MKKDDMNFDVGEEIYKLNLLKFKIATGDIIHKPIHTVLQLKICTELQLKNGVEDIHLFDRSAIALEVTKKMANACMDIVNLFPDLFNASDISVDFVSKSKKVKKKSVAKRLVKSAPK